MLKVTPIASHLTDSITFILDHPIVSFHYRIHFMPADAFIRARWMFVSLCFMLMWSWYLRYLTIFLNGMVFSPFRLIKIFPGRLFKKPTFGLATLVEMSFQYDLALCSEDPKFSLRKYLCGQKMMIQSCIQVRWLIRYVQDERQGS